jgi:hypothetical protein
MTGNARTGIQAVAFLAMLFCAGCGNVLDPHYAALPAAAKAPLELFSGKTRLYVSTNVDVDGYRLTHDGYVQLGVAAFTTERSVTVEQIEDLAKRVGADVVVCSKISLRSHRAALPFDLAQTTASNAGDSYVHVSSSVTLFGGSYGSSTSVGGGTMDFKGMVTSSGIPGVSSRDLEESNAERYRFTATFWRRAKPDGRS